ncbi:FAD-dependent oxidoreductase [Spongiactinospora gelatinilytica]|uniref:FAD-dependent oxidoreductase n=1 Tax=Spongiactinospora gelatinilytica TaxID=2666298 RepID=UPI0018F50EC5|nr:FAD-dependent oxidoreductase [Spongiactinospora gelatinilytica]
MAHVVVIGAGLYGAAVAAGLTRRGARVTVVDGGAPGQGTSGATFSWINSCGRRPQAYHRLAAAGGGCRRTPWLTAPGRERRISPNSRD